MAADYCISCEYYHQSMKNHPDKGGTCHRYPPTPHIVGADGLGRPLALGFWPVVGPKDTCGEWEIRSVTMRNRANDQAEDATEIEEPGETKTASGLIIPTNSGGNA